MMRSHLFDHGRRLRSLMERWAEVPTGVCDDALLEDLHFTLAVQAYLVMVAGRDGRPVRRGADARELLELFATKECFAAEYPGPDDSEHLALLGFDQIIVFLRARREFGGIVVDPGSIGWAVDRTTLMRLAAVKDELAPISRMLRLPRRLRAGQRAECPTKLIEVVVAYAEEDRRIRRMWLASMVVEGRPACFLVVRARGDADEVFCAIARVARGQISRPLAIFTADCYGDDLAAGARPSSLAVGFSRGSQARSRWVWRSWPGTLPRSLIVTCRQADIAPTAGHNEIGERCQSPENRNDCD